MMTEGNKNLFNSIILFIAFLSLTGFTITEKEREIAENDPLATMLLISKAGEAGLGLSNSLWILSVFRNYVDSGRYEEAAALIAADPLILFERLSGLKDVEIKLKEGLGNEKFLLLLDRQKTDVFNSKERPIQRVRNLIALAPLYIQIGEKGQGTALLLEALNEIDSLPEAYDRAITLSSLALEFSRIGDNIRATGLFDRAVKEARTLKKEASDSLYQYIAESMLQSGSNQKALEFINSTDFRFVHNKANVLLKIADHFYKSNNKKKALDLMQNVYILYQQSVKSEDTEYRIGKFIELANIYSAIAKPNESIELLSKSETLLRNSYPDNTRTQNLGPMAESFAKAGQVNKGSALLTEYEALIGNSEGSQDRMQIAESYFRIGEIEKAYSMLKTIKSKESQAEVMMQFASNLLERNEREKAKNLLDKSVVEIQWRHYKLQIADLYAKSGESKKSLEILSKELKELIDTVQPSALDSWDYLEMSKQFYRLGDEHEALRILEIGQKEIERQFKLRKDVSAFNIFELGITYCVIGHRDQGFRVFNNIAKEIKEINNVDDRRDFEVRLAMSLAKAGENQKALDLAKNLSEVDQADVWMSIAEKKIKDNKKKDGMEWLDKAFTVLKEADVTRDSYSKLISIARQYSLVPDTKKTSIVMSQILQLMSRQMEFSDLYGGGRNEYLLTADKYIEFGEYEEALRISKQMVVSGETAVIKIRIAREYIKAGDKEKALPLLSKALEEIQSLEAYSTGYYKASLLADNAAAYKKAGETGKAFVIFQQASSAVKELEDPSARATAFISIADEYEASNMREESIANLKNAVSSISEIQNIQARAYPLAEVALMIYHIGSKPDQKSKAILHEIVSAISK